jgi:hypothetical protein
MRDTRNEVDNLPPRSVGSPAKQITGSRPSVGDRHRNHDMTSTTCWSEWSAIFGAEIAEPERGSRAAQESPPAMPKHMFFLPMSGGDWFDLTGEYTVAEALIAAERQAGEPCQFGGSLFSKGAHLMPLAVPVRARRGGPSRNQAVQST